MFKIQFILNSDEMHSLIHCMYYIFKTGNTYDIIDTTGIIDTTDIINTISFLFPILFVCSHFINMIPACKKRREKYQLPLCIPFSLSLFWLRIGKECSS